MKMKEMNDGKMLVPSNYQPPTEQKIPKEIRHVIIDCFGDLISALRNMDAARYELVSLIPCTKSRGILIGQSYILTYYGEDELEFEVLC